MSFSDLVRDSPPKKGSIRIMPFRVRGFRIVGSLSPSRVVMLYAMFAPALSPTRNSYDTFELPNHHLCSIGLVIICCFNHMSVLNPSS